MPMHAELVRIHGSVATQMHVPYTIGIAWLLLLHCCIHIAVCEINVQRPTCMHLEQFLLSQGCYKFAPIVSHDNCRLMQTSCVPDARWTKELAIDRTGPQV